MWGKMYLHRCSGYWGLPSSQPTRHKGYLEFWIVYHPSRLLFPLPPFVSVGNLSLEDSGLGPELDYKLTRSFRGIRSGMGL